jgi:hypothetical protein
MERRASALGKDVVGVNEAARNLQTAQNTKLTGEMWFAGFMKRHHKLSLRQPELTSLARASGLNKFMVHTIFDMSENIVDENKITDSRILCMDETSHTVV